MIKKQKLNFDVDFNDKFTCIDYIHCTLDDNIITDTYFCGCSGCKINPEQDFCKAEFRLNVN